MEEPTSHKQQTDSQGSIRNRHLWRSIRWFAAEFAVVVSGVLVALALNAYYQNRQEATREQAYLRQIAADLHQSESSFANAMEQNQEELAGINLIAGAFTAATPPPDSTLSRVASVGFASAEPTTGAARALVSTGDLHLIREDSVRSAIIRFVSASEDYVADVRHVEMAWIRPSILTFYDFTRPLARGEHPFAVRISNLLDNPDFYTTVTDLQLAYINYAKLQRRALDEIRETRQHVDMALSE